MLEDVFLSDASVGCVYILCLHVHVVEEACAQLADGAVLAIGVEGEIFVCVEHYDIVEAQSAFLMTAHEFLIDGSERETRTEGEHAFSASFLGTLYLLLHAVSNELGSFFHAWEDVGEDFLATRNL